MFHPAREQHEQAGVGRQVNVAVAIGYGPFCIAVHDARTRVAEHEFPGTGGHLQIKAARQQRPFMYVQEVEAAAIVHVDPRLQVKCDVGHTHFA